MVDDMGCGGREGRVVMEVQVIDEGVGVVNGPFAPRPCASSVGARQGLGSLAGAWAGGSVREPPERICLCARTGGRPAGPKSNVDPGPVLVRGN